MKNYLNRTANQIIFLSMLLLFWMPTVVPAQADSTVKKETVTEEESMISPSLDLIIVQKADKTVDLKATVRAKIKGTFYKLPLLKISFSQPGDSSEKDLGFLITDELGKAILNVKAENLVTAADGTMQFKASFAGNKQMESTDAEVTIKRAWLEITPVKDDSLFSVKAKLISPGADSTIKDLTIGIFVKRSFNPLKLGEGTTDESGEVSVEIAGNLPGDDKGNITLLAKLDENETFGNLESASVQKWGIPVSDKNVQQPRALWSSHPPMWMLITFIVLMGVVWGHYIVIVIQLIRLRKEEPVV